MTVVNGAPSKVRTKRLFNRNLCFLATTHVHVNPSGQAASGDCSSECIALAKSAGSTERSYIEGSVMYIT